MTRQFEVQIDRSVPSDLAFPQWEKLDKVESVQTNVGRDYESDAVEAGTADVNLEFNTEDTIYATDDNVDLVDDSYGNGFSFIASDYFDIIDGKVTYVNCLLNQPHEKGSVYPNAPFVGSIDNYEWRFNFDSVYAALVKPGETYCIGFLGEEINYNGTAAVLTEHAKAYWYTDAGVLVRVDEFFTGALATTGQTTIKGKVTAPSTAQYLTVGTSPQGFTVGGGSRYFKYSKFQVHKYDAAYEAAHGGNYLKPFVIDSLRTTAPQAGSKIRYVSPGNQFDRNRWYPKKLIGTTVNQRGGGAYDCFPIAYKIDTITTASDFFTATNATLNLLTSGVITGTKSLNIVTTATSPATITLGALSTTYAVPVIPGSTYSFTFNGYNSIATACSVQMLANHSAGQTNMGTNIIPASAGITNFGWFFTAPAGVYAVQFQLVITGGVRNIVVDDFSLTTVTVEPGPYVNKLSFLGDFESITTPDITKYVSSSVSSAFSVILDRNNAHSGNRCLKFTKANATTTGNIRLGATANVFPFYTETRGQTAGANYVFTYWAKSGTGANANTKIQVLYKDNLSQSVISTTTLKALTTSWQQYTETIPVKSGATAIHLGIQVVADASPALDIYIDDLDVRRFTTAFRSDLSSVTANSRISVYDVDTMGTGQATMHYGNDVSELGGWSYKPYHSGTTRTRYKCTIKSIGYDAPVGTLAALAFNNVAGRSVGRPGTTENGLLAGNSPDEVNVAVTLPTAGGSVVVDVLAPDVPFASMQPALFMSIPNGSYTIGYEFINEYIGPDGYQDYPDQKEACLFTGYVDVREDSIGSMSTDGVKRSITNVKLSCVDRFGQLGNVKLDAPYKQTVLNDNPKIYLPLDDDLDAIGNLSNRVDVDFSVKTQGTPSSWGITAAETILAEDGGSLRFDNPPLTGLGGTQGQVIYGRYDGTLSNKYGASYEIWFMRDVGAADMGGNALFNHNFSSDSLGKIYVWLAGGDLRFKWGQGAGGYLTYTIGSAKADGRPHHVAMTKDKNGLVTCYFDGAPVGTFTAIERNVNEIVIGGKLPDVNQFYAGNLGHFAYYDKALPSDVIATHYQAGYYNRQTTNEVERIKYVLQSAKQPGILPVLRTRNGDMSTGLSTLNPASWSSNVSPAELIKDAVHSAGGIVFAGGDGTFIYENKQSRMSYGKAQSNTTWQISTGDNSIQPEGDFGANPDITKLVNEVKVTGKFAGASKDTSFKVADRLSQSLKVKATKEFTSSLYGADEARQTAYWDIKTHNKSLTRYRTLTFININDATDDFCRRVQPGDYLYGDIVNGNGLGKGVFKHFIERVKHTITPRGDGSAIWSTDIEVSPAYNQVVWIVEDATYGALDGQNRLGY